MQDAVLSALNSVWGVFKTIGLNDIVDILILYFLIYNGIKLIRETRAQQLTKGILVLVACYLLAVVFNLQTIRYLLKLCFQWGFLALIILFQPELRRMLEKVGRAKIAEISFFGSSDTVSEEDKWNTAIDAVCDAAQNLSSTKTGALIIFERKTKLGEQIATGTVLNCTPSVAVFGNIFYPNTPLHDGAVIMRDGMILAAGCFLPRPQKDELINKQLGSRHRAAIGMSENSDAVVVVVSEETGAISVAENGELTRGYTKESLKKLLLEKIIPDKDTNSIKENSFAGRVISKWKK
ncbi:diadenylate cyclase CdaA [uncultured Ruminococcus sp.]|uniref:diadenylate cyclase CdaA n=1 Tax=uncultured Ruminococcus sp. TaxID=165186 RepID=UPI0025D9C048|nr:diadenylate cyclase CdaA [uncultured Ruminococcus sp.]